MTGADSRLRGCFHIHYTHSVHFLCTHWKSDFRFRRMVFGNGIPSRNKYIFEWFIYSRRESCSNEKKMFDHVMVCFIYLTYIMIKISSHYHGWGFMFGFCNPPVTISEKNEANQQENGQISILLLHICGEWLGSNMVIVDRTAFSLCKQNLFDSIFDFLYVFVLMFHLADSNVFIYFDTCFDISCSLFNNQSI